MTPETMARYRGRIAEAPSICALARLERELAATYAHDPVALALLADLSLRWKELEGRA